MQADIDSRQNKEDIGRLYVSNDAGSMVPLSALVTVKPQIGARTINHYNLFRSASINGAASEGYSSSQAIAAMDGLAKETLPRGYNYEWTGNAYQEIKAGNVAPILFALAVIFAFLFLAAQYESFVMPSWCCWRCHWQFLERWWRNGCAVTTTTSMARLGWSC